MPVVAVRAQIYACCANIFATAVSSCPCSNDGGGSMHWRTRHADDRGTRSLINDTAVTPEHSIQIMFVPSTPIESFKPPPTSHDYADEAGASGLDIFSTDETPRHRRHRRTGSSTGHHQRLANYCDDINLCCWRLLPRRYRVSGAVIAGGLLLPPPTPCWPAF